MYSKNYDAMVEKLKKEKKKYQKTKLTVRITAIVNQWMYKMRTQLKNTLNL